MSGREAFRTIAIPAILLISSALACATSPFGSSAPPGSLRSVDGLERVKISMPGVLDLRRDHGIGSYDAFIVPEASLSYSRRTVKLTREAEQVFLRLLRDSLIDASGAAEIPIVETPGLCVMEIKLAVYGLKIGASNFGDRLAKLTLVMEFRDSESQEPLLRYATQNTIENPRKRANRDKKLQSGFNRIIEAMNIAAPLRASGLGDDTIEPGCNGTLAERGRAASEQR
jgi:hypothetical protein